MDPRSLKIAEMFANLNDERKANAILEEIFAPDCVFQDPIQRAEGIEAMRRMNKRLAKKMGRVTVSLLGDAAAGNVLAIRWEMKFRMPWFPVSLPLPGVSWMEFNQEGKCIRHTDYWDMTALFDRALPPLKPFHDLIRKLAG